MAAEKEALDPTINVQNLLTAAVLRIDDLRDAEILRVDQVRAAENRRIDDLRIAEGRRVDEQIKIHSQFEELLRVAEAKRIDAIRVVDINAVAVANERATAQASVLATQVQQSAETLRSLVATTATATNAQTDQVGKQLSDRIGALERTSYEGKGKEAVSDPLMNKMIEQMAVLQASVTESKGKGAGMSQMWGYIVGAAALVGAILAALIKAGII